MHLYFVSLQRVYIQLFFKTMINLSTNTDVVKGISSLFYLCIYFFNYYYLFIKINTENSINVPSRVDSSDKVVKHMNIISECVKLR